MKILRFIFKFSIIFLKMNFVFYMFEVYYREKCDRVGYKIIKKIVFFWNKNWSCILLN